MPEINLDPACNVATPVSIIGIFSLLLKFFATAALYRLVHIIMMTKGDALATFKTISSN